MSRIGRKPVIVPKGVTLQVQAPTGLAPRPDVRLVRIRIPATTPDRAFMSLAAQLGPRATGGALPQAIVPGAPLDAVLGAATALVERAVVVPLVHVPDLYGAADHVWSWQSKAILGTGAWNFADVALAPASRPQP